MLAEERSESAEGIVATAGDELDKLLRDHRSQPCPEGTLRVTVSDPVNWEHIAEAIRDSEMVHDPDVTAIEICRADERPQGFCTLEEFNRYVVPSFSREDTWGGVRSHIDTALGGTILIGKFTRFCKHQSPNGHQTCRTVQRFGRRPSPMPPCENRRGWAAHMFVW